MPTFTVLFAFVQSLLTGNITHTAQPSSSSASSPPTTSSSQSSCPESSSSSEILSLDCGQTLGKNQTGRQIKDSRRRRRQDCLWL